MNVDSPQTSAAIDEDSTDIIIIRDPEIDVEALMRQVRANVAQRRAEGAYQEDLDAIADDVRQQVLGALGAGSGPGAVGTSLSAELDSRWLIREPEFTSQAPVIGPVIVAIRRGWNWMSTKWYVRGVLDQQIGFNSLVVQELGEMRRAHEALSEELASLRTQCEEQQAEIAALREQLTAGNDAGSAKT